MERIGVYEAKQALSELVREAGRGMSVILTLRGEPIAMIVPYELRGVTEKPLLKEKKRS